MPAGQNIYKNFMSRTKHESTVPKTSYRRLTAAQKEAEKTVSTADDYRLRTYSRGSSRKSVAFNEPTLPLPQVFVREATLEPSKPGQRMMVFFMINLSAFSIMGFDTLEPILRKHPSETHVISPPSTVQTCAFDHQILII